MSRPKTANMERAMTAHDANLAAAQALFDITPLQPSIGAEIAGIDLARPLDPAARDALRAALLTYRVLFFRDQDLSFEQHIAFTANFGALEVHPVFSMPDHPAILPLRSAYYAETYRPSADAEWHSDTTFRAEPSAASVLRARIVPPIGGDTVFVNTIKAYDRLSDEVKAKIDGLTAIHDASVFKNFLPADKQDGFTAEFPPVEHPVVRVHPETGEKAIYVNAVFTRRILGVEPEEAASLLRLLFDQVKRPEFQVRWRWQPNSIAFWDNRSTQHYAVNDYVEERYMERVTVMGDRPVGPVPA
jgi:alpha-ketoglutarate-dependent sulfate ester dioxygenase